LCRSIQPVASAYNTDDDTTSTTEKREQWGEKKKKKRASEIETEDEDQTENDPKIFFNDFLFSICSQYHKPNKAKKQV
jgi:hypothetical protein